MTDVIWQLEYDREGIQISDSLSGKPGPGQISSRTAADVIAMAARFGCKKDGEWFSFKRNNAQILKPGGWVGTLQSGDKQIEVRPKIEHEGDIQVDLAELLLGAGCVDPKFRSVASMADRESIFDLLALGYAQEIAKECNRGLSRGYVEVSENIPTKRGRINFSRQWQNKARRAALLSCTYDEYSEDTQLNRILKAGARAALALVKMHKCKRSLSNTLKLLEGISDVRVTPEQAMSFRPEHKDLRFKPLIEMAARFIHNNGKHQDIRSEASGSGISGLGSMWSAWTLFESYVFRELSGINSTSKYKLGEQWEVRNQVIGRYMIRMGEEKDRRFNYALKPDIIIRNKKTGVIEYICDTKWKYQRREAKDEENNDAVEIKGRQKEYVVKKSDLFQMFSYSRFYSNKSGQHPKIALIYPSANPNTDKSTERGRNSDGGPLSELKLLETIYFNLPEGGNNKTQTAVEIYEFPVPLAKVVINLSRS